MIPGAKIDIGPSLDGLQSFLIENGVAPEKYTLSIERSARAVEPDQQRFSMTVWGDDLENYGTDDNGFALMGITIAKVGEELHVDRFCSTKQLHRDAGGKMRRRDLATPHPICAEFSRVAYAIIKDKSRGNALKAIIRGGASVYHDDDTLLGYDVKFGRTFSPPAVNVVPATAALTRGTLPPPKGRSIWPWIAGGAAIALAAVVVWALRIRGRRRPVNAEPRLTESPVERTAGREVSPEKAPAAPAEAAPAARPPGERAPAGEPVASGQACTEPALPGDAVPRVDPAESGRRFFSDRNEWRHPDDVPQSVWNEETPVGAKNPENVPGAVAEQPRKADMCEPGRPEWDDFVVDLKEE